MDWINVNRITPKPFVSVLCRMQEKNLSLLYMKDIFLMMGYG